MTEAEWLACTDPIRLLEHHRDAGISERKTRLFAVACLWRVAYLLRDPDIRRVIVFAERLADEEIAWDPAINGAAKAYWQKTAKIAPANGNAVAAGAWATEEQLGWSALVGVLNNSVAGDVRKSPELAREDRCQIIRDIFGNPFLIPWANPLSASPSLVAVAQGSYDGRDLANGELDIQRLQLLIDALEECGIREGPVVDHLRGPGPHFRGCWALDMILGET